MPQRKACNLLISSGLVLIADCSERICSWIASDPDVRCRREPLLLADGVAGSRGNRFWVKVGVLGSVPPSPQSL